jgi:hypothetical protein
VRLRIALATAVLIGLCQPASAQTQVEYIGGTNPQVKAGTAGRIELTDDHYFAFYARKDQMRVRYDRINLMEYGQQVDRRLALAMVISPIFLLSKSRKHFLTIGFTDESGAQQAFVFRVDKNSIRTALVVLEARTGRKIEYQDTEARKAGK